MDMVLFTVVLAVCAVLFGAALYYMIAKEKVQKYQSLVFAVVILGVIEVLIVSLAILCALRLSGLI